MFIRLFSRRESAAAYSVCIVGEDATVVPMVHTLLENQGYTVYTASNGEAALQLLDQIPLPDAIIVDLSVSGMNGQEFIENARLRFGRTALPPVLLLTDTQDGEATANLLEIEDYLPKPFDDDVLLGHIKRLFASATSA